MAANAVVLGVTQVGVKPGTFQTFTLECDISSFPSQSVGMNGPSTALRGHNVPENI